MTRISVIALFFLHFNALKAADDAAFLEAIAQVESGGNRKAVGKAGERGQYQVGRDAWDDASTRLEAKGTYHNQWSKWRNPVVQDMIAAQHLLILRERFVSAGISEPTPEQLALAWNRGFTGARRLRWKSNDYAVRVGNLFRLSLFKR